MANNIESSKNISRFIYLANGDKFASTESYFAILSLNWMANDLCLMNDVKN